MKYLFQFLRGISIFVTILGALLFFIIPLTSFDNPNTTNWGPLPWAIGMAVIGLLIFVISSKYLQVPLAGSKQISKYTRWGNWIMLSSIIVFLPALFPFGIGLIFLPAALIVFIVGLIIRVRGKRMDANKIN